MSNREQFNVRLPAFTVESIELVCDTYGLTKTQAIILAVDRLTHDLDPEACNPEAMMATRDLPADES